ncbi:hypothetical protein M231_06014 [Tremella mesenterica]|uniref:Beta-lactamase-related domain-containing protein n=1 Tax=Tremella mesenterica TaxID=5217 RepID=A0A4V1M3F7_TREME|nr:hypothetical protein M231_06014 [Tremella mesenterica]
MTKHLLNLETVLTKDFDDSLVRLMDSYSVPGVVLSLVRLPKSGQLASSTDLTDTLIRCYGEASPGLPVTDSTRFPLCSLTKLFTSIIAAEEFTTTETPKGLDTKVKELIPDFKFATPGADEVTVRNLLCHRSGMPGWNMGYHEKYWEMDMVERLAHLPATHKSGKAFQYSNAGYDLLPTLITKVSFSTRDTYPSLVSSFVSKIGMTSTSYTSSSTDAAAQYSPTGTPEPLTCPLPLVTSYGGFGLFSSARDMSLWLKYLSTSKRFEEACVPQMDAFFPLVFAFPWLDNMKYGMGMWTCSHRGVKMLLHVGLGAGYRTGLVMLPDYEIGWWMACNAEEGNAVMGWTMMRLVEIIAGLEKEDWVGRLQTLYPPPSLTPPISDPPILSPSAAIGTFTHPSLPVMSFDKTSTFASIPQMTALPWLPLLYGTMRPILFPLTPDLLPVSSLRLASDTTSNEPETEEAGTLWGACWEFVPHPMTHLQTSGIKTRFGRKKGVEQEGVVGKRYGQQFCVRILESGRMKVYGFADLAPDDMMTCSVEYRLTVE